MLDAQSDKNVAKLVILWHTLLYTHITCNTNNIYMTMILDYIKLILINGKTLWYYTVW